MENLLIAHAAKLVISYCILYTEMCKGSKFHKSVKNKV